MGTENEGPLPGEGLPPLPREDHDPDFDAGIPPPAETANTANRPTKSPHDSPTVVSPTELGFDPSPLDNLPGKHVGSYRVSALIGQGGFGKVFLAEDEGLGRKAALKFMGRPRDEVSLRLFDREAKALAQVSRHPHIVEIYQYGEYKGCRFFALEYVPQDAMRLLKRNPGGVPLRDALRIAADAAEALHFAHEQGILHRDVKPQNVLLESDSGAAKLADFGLAKYYEHTSTILGGIAGSPGYMSPEQAAGDRLDPRSDVYSLGATLYELICAKLPFEAPTTSELLQRIISNNSVSLRKRRPDLPGDVHAIVERALQHKREDRYQTAAEMAEALRQAIAPTQAQRIVKKRNWAMAAVGLAAGLLVALAVFLFRSPGDVYPASVPALATDQARATFLSDDVSQRDFLNSSIHEAVALPARVPSPLAKKWYRHFRDGVAFMRQNPPLYGEAVKALETAREMSGEETLFLSPLDYLVNRELGHARIARGDYRVAIEDCRRSYNQVPTERALVLVRQALKLLTRTSEDAVLDASKPTIEGAEAVYEAVHSAHVRGKARRVVRIRGGARDDFGVSEVTFGALRILPPRLSTEVPLVHYTRIPRETETVTLSVRDFVNPAIEVSLEPRGNGEILDADFRASREASAYTISDWLKTRFFNDSHICYAATRPESAAAEGLALEIQTPKDGDVVFRDEVLMDWEVRSSSSLVESILVNGEEQLEGIGRVAGKSGSRWVPLDEEQMELTLSARRAEDPAAILENVTVRRGNAPRPPAGRTYLGSAASRPSVMVLAFEGYESTVDTSEIRDGLEGALERTMDRRFDVRFFGGIEPMLSEHQQERALATQESAAEVARALPVDHIICGSVVGYDDGTEVIAKLLDARNASLLVSRAVYLVHGQDMTLRIEELANWLALAMPRLVGLVGVSQVFEAGGTQHCLFVTNVGAGTGLLRGQYVSIFHPNGSVMREIGRGRVVKTDEPYSLCTLVSSTHPAETGDAGWAPAEGDLVLVR